MTHSLIGIIWGKPEIQRQTFLTTPSDKKFSITQKPFLANSHDSYYVA